MERRHKEIAPKAAPTPDTPRPNLEENPEEADASQPPMQQVTYVGQNNAGPKKTPEADAIKQPLIEAIALDLSIKNVEKKNAGPQKTPDTTRQAVQTVPLDLSSGKKQE